MMLGDNGLTWQKNSAEINKIKELADELSDFEVHDDVVKTNRGKVLIPKDRIKEFIEYTHKILCHAGVKNLFIKIHHAQCI